MNCNQEATYGTHIHEPREEREGRFTGTIHDIVNRGGRCLIPVFALGRAQELLLILGEYLFSGAIFKNRSSIISVSENNSLHTIHNLHYEYNLSN